MYYHTRVKVTAVSTMYYHTRVKVTAVSTMYYHTGVKVGINVRFRVSIGVTAVSTMIYHSKRQSKWQKEDIEVCLFSVPTYSPFS